MYMNMHGTMHMHAIVMCRHTLSVQPNYSKEELRDIVSMAEKLS